MNLYIIRRHGIWQSPEELAETSKLSAEVGRDMADRVKWIRSYAVTEEDGRVGSVCIYQATDPEAIREHGRRIGAPSDDISAAFGMEVVNPDPQL